MTFHETIQCHVSSICVDFDDHACGIEVHANSKPDMEGTIAVVKAIDPEVCRIVVVDGDKRVAEYERCGTHWFYTLNHVKEETEADERHKIGAALLAPLEMYPFVVDALSKWRFTSPAYEAMRVGCLEIIGSGEPLGLVSLRRWTVANGMADICPPDVIAATVDGIPHGAVTDLFVNA